MHNFACCHGKGQHRDAELNVDTQSSLVNQLQPPN